jgi:hypothetical protein
MTLILTCLTPRYVLQVADRRLTTRNPQRPESLHVVDDHRNKIVLLNDSMVFSFSGHAEIGQENTDNWLARRLAETDNPNLGLKNIQRAATDYFKCLPISKKAKRHAFVAASWTRNKDGELEPGLITISNALNANSDWLQEARDGFEIDGVGLGLTSQCGICPPIGASVPETYISDLRRNARACVERNVHPLELVRLLAETIRRVASHDNSVGRSLLAVILPKCAVGRRMVSVVTPLSPSGAAVVEDPMFFHIPKDSSDLVWDAPVLVCGGAIMTGTMQFGPPAALPSVPTERAYDSDALVSADSLQNYVLNSTESRYWIGILREAGYKVEGWGVLPDTIQRLRHLGIIRLSDAELVLSEAHGWGEQFLRAYAERSLELYATAIDKLCIVLEGPLLELAIAARAERLTPEFLRDALHFADSGILKVALRERFPRQQTSYPAHR